ncbi:MAG: arginine repressor [Clostridia bacterium]|nr:arginine repressor [Clostridia bacterium]
MSRASRHSRIIEIISNNEIETQEELVSSLRDTGLDITQATVSRDIKDLGLIKIVGINKKYKYALINDDNYGTNRIPNIFKESILTTTILPNMLVIKVIRGTAQLVGAFINKLNLDDCLGVVYGEDTVLLIIRNNAEESIREKITSIQEDNI